MNPNVDLRQLAIRRELRHSSPEVRQRPHLWTRYILPGLLLVGFLGVLAWSLRDSLLPSQPVTVVPVLTVKSAEAQEAGTPLFQAAGWIEPRPTAIAVTALAEGVIDKLFVVENQEVKAGDKIAQLIEDDAKLALQMAKAEKTLKAAEVAALRASTDKELSNLTFQIQTAEARERLARLELERKNELFSRGGAPELAVSRAKTELSAAESALKELQARKLNLEKESVALIDAAVARQEVAQVAVDTADLRLKRMIVRAPASGRILALTGRPGMRVMGLSAASQQDASTVVTMYDPARLQARVDVRMDDLPKVRPGQPVQLRTPAIPDAVVEGEVLFTTSQADITKNTLQVKVAIKDPPAVLRSDMLVEATFLAPATPRSSAGATEVLRLFVPRSLVEGSGIDGKVWLADQDSGVARLRAVKLGSASGTDLVEVIHGLHPADRLIAGGREGLRDGQRIRITGEDSSFGVTSRGTETQPARVKPAQPQMNHKQHKP
jgi:HlyD family secretion protein